MTPRTPSRHVDSRHDDRRRTFPALDPLTGPTGEEFASSWWGNAWVEALEDTALDRARLTRGRAYAGRGHVDAITVTPGRVMAYVHGSRPRPYRTEIRLRTLGDDDWDDFLAAAAARPDHIAALLDKDVPHALAAVADLLPAAGDLIPDCSCPDDGYPCKHAAALCYQTARLLDEDPFVLFLMRGRGEREILADLSHRNATRSAAERAGAATATPVPTVPAHEALAPRTLPALPPPFPVPTHTGRPPAYPHLSGAPYPPPASGRGYPHLASLALDLLATEAATRAHTLLVTGTDPIAELTAWQDAVRLAAAHPGSGLTASTRALYRDLAAATDHTPTDLARAVAAWRQGGLEALAVLEEPWDPPAGPFDRARPALIAADFPHFRPWRNHLSTRSLQLRFGRDGLWYGYESDPDREDWWPRGTPDADPVGALTALLGR
ncbi:SWIM zinc finger family protein [Streptomyces sp. NBC_01142]|uniref:SWIM zinc finger family protein n=1 Tax=Streptomyces sp. NBC_01142 TaxID=2975865 RepID=UPI0022536E3A|nr:SWIM zinc finger family protein [Streptomyces sp. NBC_01142]MCX4822327.1 SWIM zinc finger family protein [Streptomyces sp. NBC_01142]